MGSCAVTQTVTDSVANVLKIVAIGGGISVFVGLIYAFVRFA
jgi:hypothetical protein